MIKANKARLAIFGLAILIILNPLFSQTDASADDSTPAEKTIQLPQVITYIPPSLENKVTYDQEEVQELHLSDLPQLLQTSGIQVLSYGAFGLEQKASIRGFTDETVRVVIDGVCVNNPQTGIFDFSTINLDNLEKIEIIKGGFTEGTDDEGAVGGVIYITTKKQNLQTQIKTDTKFKTYFNSLRPLDTISQGVNFSSPITKNLFVNTGIKVNHAQNNYRENEAKVNDCQGNLQMSYFFGNGNSLSINDIFYGGYKHTPGPKYSTNQGIQQDYNNTLTLSFFTPELSPYFTLKNNLTYLCNTRFYDDKTESSQHYINAVKYNVTADFYNWNRIKETAGLTFDYTHLDSTNDGQHNQFSGVLKETTKIAFNDIFSMSLPLAAKFSDKNFAFIPKVGFSASFKKLAITLDAYRMIQFPTMDDLFWEGQGYHGNPNLTPENGWGADLIFNFTNQIIPTNLTFFTNYYENKIQWAFSDNIWSPKNVASAFYFGLDLTFEISVFKDLVKIKGNGEYLYTRLLDKSNSRTYGKKIMWTPDLVASLSILLNFDDFSFLVEGNYTGKRYISNLNISYLEPYFLLNALVELKSLKHFKPYLRIDNMLNAKYESIENYPMPGAALTLGLQMEW